MAKIDTTKIEGYESMTAEQKLAALTAYEFEEEQGDSEVERLRSSLSKANRDAAEYKRQLRAKQSEDEARQAEEDEARQAMAQRVADLEKQIGDYEAREAVSGYEKALLGMGYTAADALASATALQKGDFAAFFAQQAKFTEAQRNAAAEKVLGEQPSLSTGGAPNATVTKEAFEKMDYTARVQLYNENPTLYANLTNQEA